MLVLERQGYLSLQQSSTFGADHVHTLKCSGGFDFIEFQIYGEAKNRFHLRLNFQEKITTFSDSEHFNSAA